MTDNSKPIFNFNFHAPVGQNIANVEHMDVHMDKDGNIQVMNAQQIQTEGITQKDEPSSLLPMDLFKYISPFVTDEAERLNIHRAIVNLVKGDFPMGYICKNLLEMHDDKKIALNVAVENQYNELVRLGLPENKDGFSLSNYRTNMPSKK